MKDLAETLADAIPDEVRLRTARVVSVAGDSRTLTVQFDGTNVTVPRLLGWTPYTNDVVLLIGSAGFWYAVGCLTAQQASSGPTPPVVPIPPAATTGTATIQAYDSGSWRGGSWRGDTSNVIQGDYTGSGVNSGAWFYGDKIRGTLAGATVLGARIYVPRISGGVFGAQTATIRRHDRPSKSGAPTYSGANAGTASLAVNESGWIGLAASEIQPLTTADGGLGLVGASPYFVANSVAGDRQSGTLQIDWKR